jgi:hypothetical protein
MKTNANKPMPGGDPVDPDTDGQIMKFLINKSQNLTTTTT